MKHQRLFDLVEKYILLDEEFIYRMLEGECPTDADFDTTKEDRLWDEICSYIDRHGVEHTDEVWRRVIGELDGEDVVEALYAPPVTVTI